MTQPLAEALLLFMYAGLATGFGCWWAFFQPSYLRLWLVAAPLVGLCIAIVDFRSGSPIVDAVWTGGTWGPVVAGLVLAAFWLRMRLYDVQERIESAALNAVSPANQAERKELVGRRDTHLDLPGDQSPS